ncbi:MAG: hypothetical protein V3T31_13565 [candidate division Zixibacteria bacterium]
MRFICAVIGLLVFSMMLVPSGFTFDIDEHRSLGDSAFSSTMRAVCDTILDDGYVLRTSSDSIILPMSLFSGFHFGQQCSIAAKDDFSADRFHEPGKSVLGQLERLSAESIGNALESVKVQMSDQTGRVRIGPVNIEEFIDTPNVISAYLFYHLLALHIAAEGIEEDDTRWLGLQVALRYEAEAQSYLVDAFSSSHMLVDRRASLAGLQHRNIVEAHHFYRNSGLYVIDSRGHAWRTFGDEIMHWYAPAYDAVLNACQTSLKELLTVYCYRQLDGIPGALTIWLDSVTENPTPSDIVDRWLEIHDGADYYRTLQLPTLLLLPMPVSATFSFRTDEKDEHGIRRRFHYPQLREDGFHDPDSAGIDFDFLYPRSAIPDWLVPPPLLSSPSIDPDSLIKFDPDYASVRWIQDRSAPPSYKGLLFHMGGQLTRHVGTTRTNGLFGIGYGIWDDLILLRSVSFSLLMAPSLFDPNRLLMMPTFGGGLATGPGIVHALRLEAGVAIGLQSSHRETGSMFAVGVDSRVLPFHFTNAGVTCRLKYQWINLDKKIHGPSFELIFQ